MAWCKAQARRLAGRANRTQSALEMVLFPWAGWFDFVATAGAVTNPKPNPQPWRDDQIGLTHLGTPKSRRP